MNITIDSSKCIKCGRCLSECPADVLALGESIEIVNPDLCNSCGHCAAICPVDTFGSGEDAPQPFKIVRIDNSLPEQKMVFHKKRSVRAFKNEPIGSSKIKELIEYAEKAPSSHNFRRRKYLVITSSEDIEQINRRMIGEYKNILKILNPVLLKFISLYNKKTYNELKSLVTSFKHMINEFDSGKDKIFRNSKCIICIYAPTGSTHSKDDCIASQQYMLLYGKIIGIDSFIVGYAQHVHKILEKYYHIEKGYSIFAVSALGFGKYEYEKEVIYEDREILWK
jgi:NAD-dependent dihydropyrimidine dehydrogenase PreA subunit/nitroreductase